MYETGPDYHYDVDRFGYMKVIDPDPFFTNPIPSWPEYTNNQPLKKHDFSEIETLLKVALQLIEIATQRLEQIKKQQGTNDLYKNIWNQSGHSINNPDWWKNAKVY